MSTALVLIVILSGATIAVFLYGLAIAFGRRRAILAERLETYAAIEEEAATSAQEELRGLTPIQRFLHVLLGRAYLQKIEDDLAQADIPMKAAEYFLARLVLAGFGFAFGMYGETFGLRGLQYVTTGVVFAAIGYLLPGVFVRIHQHRRRVKFVQQLADALMLLTNSLRSGYGFLKGLELIAKEMSDPIAKELNRMLREVNLGATVEQALMNLGRRVNSQDLDIVISAYLIQKDVGGNLTEIMEKVAETIRERIRIQGDIRVLTAQGRLSGLIVGLMPLGLFIFFLVKMPDYFKPLLGPPTMSIGGMPVPVGVLLLLGAFVLQLVGGYLIFKIINIRV